MNDDALLRKEMDFDDTQFAVGWLGEKSILADQEDTHTLAECETVSTVSTLPAFLAGG